MACIVFDLDGTLIDSAPDIRACANAVLADMGLKTIDLAQTHSFIGSGTAVFIERLRAAKNLPDNLQNPMLATFMVHYETAVALTQIYPNVVEALTALQAAGHRLGICTNKPIQPTRKVLSHFGLDGFFEVVVGGDSLTVRKPDPAPLHAVFDAMGDSPQIYVGDSDVDAQTAQAAQVPFALFTMGYHHQPIAALPHDRSFDDHAELPDLITAFLR